MQKFDLIILGLYVAALGLVISFWGFVIWAIWKILQHFGIL